jgi:fermentation-respiration switch protein FrsA (DUF1100 family)
MKLARHLSAGAAIVAVLYLALVVVLFGAQRSLLYRPSSILRDPIAMGLPEIEVVRLRTADGLDLVSWFAPPRRASAPTVVFFHGNSCNLSCWSYKARDFLDAGLGVMLAGYRGFEGNAGFPNEAGLLADGRAALDWLAARGISGADVVVYGESLGTGVAVRMASERRVGAVIIEAAYTSISDVASDLFPFLPARWLVLDRFDNLAHIREIGAPVLIVHGERDRLVPAALGRALYSAARAPKRALWVSDGGHNDLWARIRLAVIDFAAERGLERRDARESP